MHGGMVMSDQTGTYLLGCQEFLKIGYTSVGVHMRIKAMQTGNPFTLHPLAIVPSTPDLEPRLHRLFASLHHRGEWFYDTEEIHRWFAVNGQSLELKQRTYEPPPQRLLLITVAEAARSLSASTGFVMKLIHDSEVQAFKVGNGWRLKPESLQHWVLGQSS